MSTDKTTSILVLSIYRDLAESFVELLTPEQSEGLTIGDHHVHFDIFDGDPAQDDAFQEHISKADAITIAARFLDVLSLEKIKAIYRELPTQGNVPVAIFLLRDKGEIDFKISCPSCGQKLWLRDTDIDKRGRCPNCKKPFVILSQSDYLRSQLMLPDGLTITQVVRNDFDSFQAAVTKLLKLLSAKIQPMIAGAHAEALKQATVRIQIQEN